MGAIVRVLPRNVKAGLKQHKLRMVAVASTVGALSMAAGKQGTLKLTRTFKGPEADAGQGSIKLGTDGSLRRRANANEGVGQPPAWGADPKVHPA